MSKKKNSRIYYGYIVLVACFLIMLLVYGSQYSFGVFFKPMLNEFGWTRAATSGPFSLYMIVGGFLAIITGKLNDRFGPRKVVTVGGIIYGLGYLLTSRIGNLWQLYFSYGVLSAAGSSAMYIPLVSMLTRWFTRRRGLIAGIGISGIGFGIGIVPSIASQLVESFNWRVSFLIVGMGCLVLIVLLAQFLRAGPETAVLSDRNENTNVVSRRNEFSINETIKTPQFWMICIAWLFYGFFSQVSLVHTVPYATDLGMSAIAAATILTAIGIVGIFGRISLGFIGDRIGNKTTIFTSFAITAAAYIGISISGTVWMLYVFAVIFGALSGIGILLVPAVSEYYGYKELGMISGAIIFAYNLGGAIGPPLAGGVFDTTGSYELAFVSCGILAVASSIVIWLVKPPSK